MTGFFTVRLCRLLTFTKESDPVSLVSADGVFVFPAHVGTFFIDLLISVPVITGAGLLGSFLGKAFVAIIQKFSNE